jgi:hypothetical protein
MLSWVCFSVCISMWPHRNEHSMRYLEEKLLSLKLISPCSLVLALRLYNINLNLLSLMKMWSPLTSELKTVYITRYKFLYCVAKQNWVKWWQDITFYSILIKIKLKMACLGHKEMLLWKGQFSSLFFSSIVFFFASILTFVFHFIELHRQWRVVLVSLSPMRGICDPQAGRDLVLFRPSHSAGNFPNRPQYRVLRHWSRALWFSH